MWEVTSLASRMNLLFGWVSTNCRKTSAHSERKTPPCTPSPADNESPAPQNGMSSPRHFAHKDWPSSALFRGTPQSRQQGTR